MIQKRILEFTHFSSHQFSKHPRFHLTPIPAKVCKNLNTIGPTQVLYVSNTSTQGRWWQGLLVIVCGDFLADAPAQEGIQEALDVAVHDAVEAAHVETSAGIFDALVGMQEIVANL
jgi:hypothetical protein